MSVISINWNKTKKSFLDWLIKSDLKIFLLKIFTMKIYHYGGLQIFMKRTH